MRRAGEGESESSSGEGVVNAVQFRVICAMIWQKCAVLPSQVYVISHFPYEEVCGDGDRKEEGWKTALNLPTGLNANRKVAATKTDEVTHYLLCSSLEGRMVAPLVLFRDRL